MSTSLQLADVLQRLMARPRYRYTAGLVSKLAGVPRGTIENWLDGQVRKPRHWQDLVKVADALRLSRGETNRLLQVAGHPPIETLLVQTVRAGDRALLASWASIGQGVSHTAIARYHARPPVPPDSFVGRAEELAALIELLQYPDVRLLTLTGPGGAGKTRLVLHLAALASDSFTGDVCFIALAPLRDSALVASAIGQALGIAALDDQALIEHMREELHDRQMLLILDNFEHVAAAAPLVTDLLAAAPRLKIVITSRLALRLRGEHAFPVPPLALPHWAVSQQRPASFDVDAVAQLARCPAVALFVQRAQAAHPGFQLTSANALAVATICIRLDGLPLAIELAAARSKVLDPLELQEQLEGNRLRVLTGGPRDAPVRQQTLLETLAWSYDLLDAAAQQLFQDLAVFAGGFSLEVAERVCNDPVNPARERASAWPTVTLSAPARTVAHTLLDTLERLVDHSLLVAQINSDGTSRFVMLETIREYALDRLLSSGKLATMRRRHAAYYLALAETAEPRLRGAEQAAWLARLDVEHDNLRVALGWVVEEGSAEVGLRLAAALGAWWCIRGCLREGRCWLERMLQRSSEAPTSARARALFWMGILAWWQSDHESATTFCTSSLTLFQELGDKEGIAAAWRALGNLAREQGDFTQSTALLRKSLELFQELGNNLGIASALHNLGDTLREQGDHAAATPLLVEGLGRFRASADKEGVAWVLISLADIACYQRDDQQAAMLYQEILGLTRELGYTWGIAVSLRRLGWLAQVQGDDVQAIAHYTESLALFRNVGAKAGAISCIASIAGVIGARGQWQRATRLLGAVNALLETIRGRMNATDQTAYDQSVGKARAELDTASFQAAWTQGRTLTLEQAIAQALGDN